METQKNPSDQRIDDRPQVTQAPNSARRWFLMAFSSGLLTTLGGCPNPSPSKPSAQATAKVGRGDLPPLKIGILEFDQIQEVLQSRWQEFSEQPIEIVKIDPKQLMNQGVPSLDAILYPANFLGTLSEKDWIAPLPLPLIDRLGGGKKSSQAVQEAQDSSPQGIEGWSSRWRSIARYNGKWMALPMGAPCWVAATRGLDIGPLKELQKAISSNQNSPKIASDTFEAFLSQTESSLVDSLQSRRNELSRLLENRSGIDKRALVNRFLWIMSTTESRYRGLIDPYKVTARISLPEFTRSAQSLQRIALIEPSTIFVSPEQAWEQVAQGQAVLGIGWPRSDGFQRGDIQSDAKTMQLIPILFNSGDGMLASIGRKTRQSSMASEFLHWIQREDNRVALQAKSPRVEVQEIDNDPNRVREDYREYQTLQRLEASNATLDMTPRFLNADPFIDSLGDALLDIIADPQSAQMRLEECKAIWEQLIQTTGSEVMRSSLERATGLSN